MTVTIREFLNRLERCGILDEETVAGVRASIDPSAIDSDGKAFVKQLHRGGILTGYQAKSLWRDRGHMLAFGNYIVEDELGRGGMGVVLKARHARMQRYVAIKVLPVAMASDADAVARFQREVVAASQLMHPNIVAAHDADEADGRHFLVMEFVDGRDLASTVREHGGLSVAQAVDCIRQAATGLEYAHERGVVHRDVKPANLLLDERGTIKVLDMGLARFSDAADVETQADLTGAGSIMGTVDYMSPEQAEDTHRADERSDQYSLGMSLYYLLCGRPAYEGNSLFSRMTAHLNDPIPDLRDVRDDIPESLQEVFARMAAKDPAERYSTMREVIDALDACGLAESGTVRTVPARATTGGTGRSVSLNESSRAYENVTTDMDESAPHREGTTGTAVDDDPVDGERTVVGHAGSETIPSLVTEEAPAQGTSHDKVGAWWVPLTDVRVLAGVVGAVLLVLVVAFSDFGSGETEPSGRGDEGDAQDPLTAEIRGPGGEDPKDDDPRADAPSPVVAPFSAAAAMRSQSAWASHLGEEIATTNSIGTNLVLIPPGTFTMGELDRATEVTLSRPIRFGVHEVTRREWTEVMFTEPWSKSAEDSVAPDLPATHVGWFDAKEFCDRLTFRERASGAIGLHDAYRLPTSAEWEYACRAGTTFTYSYGEDGSVLNEFAWFADNADGPQPVGGRRANRWGLHDVHGNVYEWCLDRYGADRPESTDPTGPETGDERVHRGGAWNSPGPYCRSAFRDKNGPWDRLPNLGFRIVLVRGAANASSKPDVPFTRDRAAAEWVVSMGGAVNVYAGRDLRHIRDLPDEPFRLRTAELLGSDRFAAADLHHLADLPDLRLVKLQNTNANATSLASLATCPRLYSIHLDNTGIRSSDLEILGQNRAFREVLIDGSQFDSWRFLDGRTRIRSLTINGGSLPSDLDGAWNSPRLHTLWFTGATLDDELVEGMQSYRPSVRVVVGQDSPTVVSHDSFTKSLRDLVARGFRCRYSGYSGESWSTDDASAPDVTAKRIDFIAAPGSVSREDVRNLMAVETGDLDLTAIEDADSLVAELADVVNSSWTLVNSDLGDPGLSVLASCSGLYRIDIRGTRVSKGGVREFKRRNPGCLVISDFGKFGYEHRLPDR